MFNKNSSEYQKSVSRLRLYLQSFQTSLQSLFNCPLMSNDDIPLIKIWLCKKGIRNIFNSICIPIQDDSQPFIKLQNLEEYRAINDGIKIQHHDEMGLGNHSNQSKIQESANQSSALRSVINDSSFQEGQNSTAKKQYKRGPYKNYTIEQKKDAVQMLLKDNLSVIQISRRLQIPCKNIKRWSQQGVLRKKGGGRKRFSPQTQKAVSDYLKKHYASGSQVPYQAVQDIARQKSDDENFKASRGWVVKFVDRQQLRNYYKFV